MIITKPQRQLRTMDPSSVNTITKRSLRTWATSRVILEMSGCQVAKLGQAEEIRRYQRKKLVE